MEINNTSIGHRTVLLSFKAVETATENERDMQHLRWGNIKLIDGVQTIYIIKRKTNHPATIPLNDMALSLLPSRENDNPDNLVLRLVKKSDNISKYVRHIKNKAGIGRDFTYHLARHTTNIKYIYRK